MKKFLVLPLIFLSACQMSASEPYTWAGRWAGPEGTYLDLAQRQALDTAPSSYDIVIRDLDREYHYSGQAQGDTIVFTRNGKTETIRQGDGQETGMKWLADKKRCLIINTGEGYCRN